MSLMQKVSDRICSVQERASRSRIWELQRTDRIVFFVGLGITLFMIILAIFADFLAPSSPFTINEESVHEPPSWAHLMGTDSIGRDIFSRVIYGARISLLISLLAVLISGGLGAILGVMTGYYGGKLDRAITLPMDALYSFPAFLTALLIVTTLGGGFIYTALAVAVGLLPRFYRTVRSAAISLREEPFVEAEVSIGASDIYIIFKHIFPLTFSVLFVVLTISVATAILSIAGLGFLGLGVTPPTPEWGSDLAAGRPNILSGVWWTTLGPAVFIFLTVLGFNLLGEGLNKLFGSTLEEI